MSVHREYKVKYIHSSNTSTTFTMYPPGYMFQPTWAIIRPHIWTGSFDYGTFWDPKLFIKILLQCCVLLDILRLKQTLKRQMSIKKIMLVKSSSVLQNWRTNIIFLIDIFLFNICFSICFDSNPLNAELNPICHLPSVIRSSPYFPH